MSETKHTPTPWRIRQGSKGLSVGIRGNDGREVATSSWHHCSPHYPTQAVTVANFEMIVEAVNSHAALQERVRRLEEALTGLVECHDQFNASSGNMEQAYYKLAKYAYPQWQAARAALGKEG